ncbi:MAG: glycyl-radical enzyme activating protein [Clostridia bacterium]|nr:glycyl-radical enzyme activating protein [Clostridia bacterium]
MKATIFDIQRNSFVDGSGIRTTVFFKGCNLRCKWCHNPESQNLNKEILFYINKCTGCGRCMDLTVDDENFICLNDAKEICGKEYTVEEVLKEVLKDKSFYENSDGGVTFSGGECMLQIDFLCEILKRCKENNIHTAVDTAGNVPWKYFEKIIPYTDVFLYDVKCISEDLHVKGTGFSNRHILENLQLLSSVFTGKIYIRIPVIGGFNDNQSEFSKISQFLKIIKYDTIELLPYHNIGKHKYAALNMAFQDYSIPDESSMTEFKKILGI